MPEAIVLPNGHVIVIHPSANVLKIHSDDGVDDGAYVPPHCTTISGEKGILQLRDLLNKHFPPQEVVK